MFPKSGSVVRTSRPVWQRLLSAKSARLYIGAVGCVALVTYIWVVFFLHPARVHTTIKSDIHVGRRSYTTTVTRSNFTHAAFPPRRTAPSPRSPARPPPPLVPEAPRPMRHHPHKDAKYRLWKLPSVDRSARCKQSGICDGNYECGPDKMGCIRDAAQRKQKVVEAAKWTWKGYRQYAWGHDELNAGSRDSREWFNMGLTIVDSLDTLLLLGLQEEYAEARFWVINHLDFNQGEVSVFETTIRILGGLAAAFYHSGGDELYLLKAVEFADRLLPAFNTSTGLPVPHFNVHDKDVAHYRTSVGTTCLAEAGTLSMEFSAVSRLSGNPEYRDTAMAIWGQLATLPNLDGLICTMINGDSLTCLDEHYTFGPAADSAYEYMLKQWILSNGTDVMCLDMYKKAIGGMRKNMLTRLWMGEDTGEVWIAAENDHGTSLSLVLPHLTCFLPGTLALGHMYGINTALSPHDDDDLMLAVKLSKACYELYHQPPSGVAYDSVRFNPHYSPPPPSPSPPPSSPPPPPSPPPVLANTSGAATTSSAAAAATTSNTTVVNTATVQQQQLGEQHQVQNQQQGQAQGGQAQRAQGQQQQSQQQQSQQPQQGQQQRQQHSQVGVGSTSRHLLEEAGSSGIGQIKYEMVPLSRENFLRPEVAETMFYLWRATGDPIYREWGWSMFRAYEHWCRVQTGGYQTISNVERVPPHGANKMESFWMAETLKYFYLLFSDDPEEVPLDEFVFNTEAHPLAIWGSKTDLKLRAMLEKVHGTKAGGSGGGDGSSSSSSSREALSRLDKVAQAARLINNRSRRR